MSSCKKNCSCNRCKPYGVVPVSKILKGIDVAQTSKCDCSGRINYRTDNFVVTANICPNCTPINSSVSFKFLDNSLLFNSTFVSAPRCRNIGSDIVLDVVGFGTFINNSTIIQVNFTFSLFKHLLGDERIGLVFTYFDQNGGLDTYSIAEFVEGISINFCNSCP